MFIPSSRVRVFACVEPIDMRNSFSGLSGVVRKILNNEPLSGHVFVFFNHRRNYVKLLYWERTGYCIMSKKLTKGTFAPITKEVMTTAELSQVLEGVDISRIKKSGHYEYIPD